MFNRLTALNELDLSHNDLDSLPVSVFNSTTELYKIRLNNNRLTDLPAGLFRRISDFIIYLGGNSFPQTEKDRLTQALGTKIQDTL